MEENFVKKKYHFLIGTAFCVLIEIFIHAEALAQEQQSNDNNIFVPNTILLNELEPKELSDYVSVGLAYSLARFMRLNAIATFEYGHRFSSNYGIETSLYYADTYNTFANNNFMLTSLIWSISGTAQISTGIPLKVGLGSAVRWYSLLRNQPDILGVNLPLIYFVEVVQLGINTQLEYSIPLSQTFEIGVRGQGQLFFEPTFLRSNTTISQSQSLDSLNLSPRTTAYTVNVGAFFRINF
jgi:hypothetical protein